LSVELTVALAVELSVELTVALDVELSVAFPAVPLEFV